MSNEKKPFCKLELNVLQQTNDIYRCRYKFKRGEITYGFYNQEAAETDSKAVFGNLSSQHLEEPKDPCSIDASHLNGVSNEIISKLEKDLFSDSNYTLNSQKIDSGLMLEDLLLLKCAESLKLNYEELSLANLTQSSSSDTELPKEKRKKFQSPEIPDKFVESYLTAILGEEKFQNIKTFRDLGFYLLLKKKKEINNEEINKVLSNLAQNSDILKLCDFVEAYENIITNENFTLSTPEYEKISICLKDKKPKIILKIWTNAVKKNTFPSNSFLGELLNLAIKDENYFLASRLAEKSARDFQDFNIVAEYYVKNKEYFQAIRCLCNTIKKELVSSDQIKDQVAQYFKSFLLLKNDPNQNLDVIVNLRQLEMETLFKYLINENLNDIFQHLLSVINSGKLKLNETDKQIILNYAQEFRRKDPNSLEPLKTIVNFSYDRNLVTECAIEYYVLFKDLEPIKTAIQRSLFDINANIINLFTNSILLNEYDLLKFLTVLKDNNLYHFENEFLEKLFNLDTGNLSDEVFERLINEYLHRNGEVTTELIHAVFSRQNFEKNLPTIFSYSIPTDVANEILKYTKSLTVTDSIIDIGKEFERKELFEYATECYFTALSKAINVEQKQLLYEKLIPFANKTNAYLSDRVDDFARIFMDAISSLNKTEYIDEFITFLAKNKKKFENRKDIVDYLIALKLDDEKVLQIIKELQFLDVLRDAVLRKPNDSLLWRALAFNEKKVAYFLKLLDICPEEIKNLENILMWDDADLLINPPKEIELKNGEFLVSINYQPNDTIILEILKLINRNTSAISHENKRKILEAISNYRANKEHESIIRELWIAGIDYVPKFVDTNIRTAKNKRILEFAKLYYLLKARPVNEAISFLLKIAQTYTKDPIVQKHIKQILNEKIFNSPNLDEILRDSNLFDNLINFLENLRHADLLDKLGKICLSKNYEDKAIFIFNRALAKNFLSQQAMAYVAFAYLKKYFKNEPAFKKANIRDSANYYICCMQKTPANKTLSYLGFLIYYYLCKEFDYSQGENLYKLLEKNCNDSILRADLTLLKIRVLYENNLIDNASIELEKLIDSDILYSAEEAEWKKAFKFAYAIYKSQNSNAKIKELLAEVVLSHFFDTEEHSDIWPEIAEIWLNVFEENNLAAKYLIKSFVKNPDNKDNLAKLYEFLTSQESMYCSFKWRFLDELLKNDYLATISLKSLNFISSNIFVKAKEFPKIYITKRSARYCISPEISEELIPEGYEILTLDRIVPFSVVIRQGEFTVPRTFSLSKKIRVFEIYDNERPYYTLKVYENNSEIFTQDISLAKSYVLAKTKNSNKYALILFPLNFPKYAQLVKNNLILQIPYENMDSKLSKILDVCVGDEYCLNQDLAYKFIDFSKSKMLTSQKF